ncbi:hypothetical protein D9758_002422 [Tetrapyrgos nigripes]|uniref:NAD(P)-binding protein n=1 Tax=Tetrapyrgos nigripes TaxID=182062 RepID=A0A8H5GPC2_9AGAR|nr:hypothetical protein D9758_002422 [Tetrapyrgos nigripes]
MPTILDSKCVLVTGATSGIGRALALEIAKLPSNPKVIGSGRRQERLDELSQAGIEGMQLDLNADRETLKTFVENLVNKNPELDTAVLCAGIQRQHKFKEGIDLDTTHDPSNPTAISLEWNVNYLSAVTIITYLLPHFLKLTAAGRPCSIIVVTSGIGIITVPMVPNYCATKSALHSFTTALRAQVKDANVHVAEIIPPLVESELHDAQGTTERLSKIWMPLDEFTRNVMNGLKNGDPVIAVGSAKGNYERFELPKEEILANFVKVMHKQVQEEK